eukprot:2260544-Amphidinium_carterae.1
MVNPLLAKDLRLVGVVPCTCPASLQDAQPGYSTSCNHPLDHARAQVHTLPYFRIVTPEPPK